VQRRLAQILGSLIGFVALIGLISSDSRLYGLINADIAMDVMRIALAAALVYIGFARTSAHTMHSILAGTGTVYVALAILGIVQPELWGILPAGLTGFDNIVHAIAGTAVLAAAFMPHARNSSAHA
jgi:hypothetical protein